VESFLKMLANTSAYSFYTYAAATPYQASRFSSQATPPADYTAKYDALGEKAKQTIDNLVATPKSGTPITPSSNSGLFAFVAENNKALNDALLEATKIAVSQNGFAYARTEQFNDYETLPDFRQGYVSDGPMHVTISNFRKPSSEYQTPYFGKEWVETQLKDIKPLRLKFDRLMLDPGLNVLATFIPEESAEAARAKMRQDEFAADEFKYPDIWHTTLARLSPKTELKSEQNQAQLRTLTHSLEQATRTLREQFKEPVTLNKVSVVHNQHSRGLLGKDPSKAWGPDTYHIDLKG
jgi:hypothetical protein